MNSALLRPPKRVARSPGQIRAGFGYLRERADLLLIFGVTFCVGTFAMNFQMTNALMAQHEFHQRAAGYGILGSVMAVGSLAGSLVAARRTSKTRVRLIVALGVGFGLFEILLGFMPTYLSYVIALPLGGLMSISILTACNTTV